MVRLIWHSESNLENYNMPVKRDYEVNPTWFISHTPFDLGGATLVEDIKDMVSYDILPIEEDKQIRAIYRLGRVEEGRLFRVVFKNLTQNTVLKIGAEYNKTMVKILSDDDTMIEQDNILLGRGETKSARLFLNTDVFNSYSSENTIETNIQLLVSHVANGDVIKRDEQMVSLEQRSIVSSVVR